MSIKDNNSDKITLWTRQNIRSLDDLKGDGAIRITRHHLEEKFGDIAEYIIRLYNWFVDEADKRVPKPSGLEFPIWCSISEENMLRPTEDTVVYVLEVDRSEILYFDGVKWDQALNHLYIPKDEKDKERYLEDIQRKGFKDEFSVFDSSIIHFYPGEKQRIIDSWIRVFEIDEWDIFRVQANIWEIRQDMIQEIINAE